MDQASDNIIKMLMQGMFTGKVGPLDQSPDLPILGFGATRQAAGLPGQVPQESSKHKTATPEQIIQDIIESRQQGTRGPMSLTQHPHTSSGLLSGALRQVPMNWRGGRQSTNIEDRGSSDVDIMKTIQSLVQNKPAMSQPPPPMTEFDLQGRRYPATPMTPTMKVLEQIMLSDPRFWKPDIAYGDQEPRPDMPDLFPD